jgi:hypothetical protein
VIASAVALDHLRLDLDRLSPGARWTLVEMHLAIGIDPTINVRRHQSR